MDSFEDRLDAAIDEVMHYQTADNGRINTGTLAATLIARGVVADPVQHQEDLTAIMEKQVRDSEGWTDEFVTTVDDPMTQNPDYISSITDHSPQWEPHIPTWHRRVTEWREVHRA